MSVSAEPTIMVVPNSLNGWDVKAEHSPDIIAHFSRQEDAIQTAKDICSRKKCQIYIVKQSKRVSIL
jgi:hypothetical protein